MDKKILGKQLKQIRISRGMSQEKLSELVYLSPRQMSIIETGNSYPSLDTFVRIAEVLEFDINEFLNILTLSKILLTQLRKTGVKPPQRPLLPEVPEAFLK